MDKITNGETSKKDANNKNRYQSYAAWVIFMTIPLLLLWVWISPYDIRGYRFKYVLLNQRNNLARLDESSWGQELQKEGFKDIYEQADGIFYESSIHSSSPIIYGVFIGKNKINKTINERICLYLYHSSVLTIINSKNDKENNVYNIKSSNISSGLHSAVSKHWLSSYSEMKPPGNSPPAEGVEKDR